ncbi:cyclin-domain-containing protein [Phlebopus sp. FC_14]|nr:cyclin-domain-containing protein [Phlebopus sp. FC_14]
MVYILTGSLISFHEDCRRALSFFTSIMLALVHPVHTSEHRNIDRTIERNVSGLSTLPISASSSSAARSRRSSQRKPAGPAGSLHSSSSSHCLASKTPSTTSAVAYDSLSVPPNAAPPCYNIFYPSSTSQVASAPDDPSIYAPPSRLPQVGSSTAPSSVDIHSYAPAELLKLLASLLTQIASTNDALSAADQVASAIPNLSYPGPTDEATRTPFWQSLTSASRSSLSNPTSALTFHARNIPTIALDAYLLRILKYCPTTNEVFLALLVYFDRMSRLASEATGRTFVIDSYNVHRLVIAGVTVASKFFSDVFYTNSRYAKVGGLPQSELNQLELQFLLLNDFRLVISPDEMQKYAEQLVLFSQSQSQGPSSPSSSNATALSHPPPAQQRPSPSYSSSSTSSAGPRAMGAIDAYGGAVAPDRTPSMRAMRTRDDDASSILSETDTETETEGGDTTDDEPTIRPPNSGSSCCGDSEDMRGEGEFRADGIRDETEEATYRHDKDRDRGDATPEPSAQRRAREVSDDIGMKSP